jgi:hypothetical protein
MSPLSLPPAPATIGGWFNVSFVDYGKQKGYGTPTSRQLSISSLNALHYNTL